MDREPSSAAISIRVSPPQAHWEHHDGAVLHRRQLAFGEPSEDAPRWGEAGPVRGDVAEAQSRCLLPVASRLLRWKQLEGQVLVGDAKRCEHHIILDIAAAVHRFAAASRQLEVFGASSQLLAAKHQLELDTIVLLLLFFFLFGLSSDTRLHLLLIVFLHICLLHRRILLFLCLLVVILLSIFLFCILLLVVIIIILLLICVFLLLVFIAVRGCRGGSGSLLIFFIFRILFLGLLVFIPVLLLVLLFFLLLFFVLLLLLI
mmetsp:Transcript_24612/g.57146  ORF Transcript_24612/g.57146 Transcript_24612/m.57146 type:complete len:260 (+) Transcript_24612:730-1509(+)